MFGYHIMVRRTVKQKEATLQRPRRILQSGTMPARATRRCPQRKKVTMARINLGGGRWFDTDKAECFEEDTRFNGNNHISVATGTQWDHEELYRTAKGMWIKHSWSQWQGSTPHYGEMDEDEARQWLIDQDHGDDVERFWPGELAAAEV
jgi:hypothetical protein